MSPLGYNDGLSVDIRSQNPKHGSCITKNENSPRCGSARGGSHRHTNSIGCMPSPYWCTIVGPFTRIYLKSGVPSGLVSVMYNRIPILLLSSVAQRQTRRNDSRVSTARNVCPGDSPNSVPAALSARDTSTPTVSPAHNWASACVNAHPVRTQTIVAMRVNVRQPPPSRLAPRYSQLPSQGLGLPDTFGITPHRMTTMRPLTADAAVSTSARQLDG